jgi:hypothetical protein
MRHVCILAGILALSGCSNSTDRTKPAEPKAPSVYVQPPPILYSLTEKDGCTAFEFGKWLVVFEGIPARPENANRKGTFLHHEPVYEGPAGYATSDWAGLKMKQIFDSRATTISVGEYEFKIMDAGRKLAVADQTFQAKEERRTIVIGKDGKAREDTKK